jgi:hypothetical protein
MPSIITICVTPGRGGMELVEKIGLGVTPMLEKF